MIRKTTQLLIAVVALLAISVPSMAQRATPIQGSGTAWAINAFQFMGAGTVRVGPTVVAESSLASIISLVPGPGGSLVGQSTHTYTFGAMGTVTTLDDVRLTPINTAGLFDLLIRGKIVGGTGAFTGATGHIFLSGTANMAIGQVTWQMHGQYR